MAYKPLRSTGSNCPRLTEPEAALAPGAVLIHPELGDNLMFADQIDSGGVDEAFATADRTIDVELVTDPHTANDHVRPWRERRWRGRRHWCTGRNSECNQRRFSPTGRGREANPGNPGAYP